MMKAEWFTAVDPESPRGKIGVRITDDGGQWHGFIAVVSLPRLEVLESWPEPLVKVSD